MATIKSFTDLSQSKTLSTIMPHESADMSWVSCDDGQQQYYQAENRKITLNYEKKHWIPCWSLAALLDVLPDKICLNDETYYLNCNKKKVKYLGPMTCDGQKSLLVEADNLVDACYEMITKLKEKNLL